MSEKELLDRITAAQNGDAESISMLLEEYKSMVRALSRPLFLIDGDQDDLIQEGMIGLFKAIQSYDVEKGAGFETFANLCITRQLYSAVKASNRKKNIPLNTYVSLYSVDKEMETGEGNGLFMLDKMVSGLQQSPEDILIEQESVKNTENRLYQSLSKMETQVLDLYLKGLSYQDIAGELQKPSKSIDNALQRIKSKLHKVLG